MKQAILCAFIVCLCAGCLSGPIGGDTTSSPTLNDSSSVTATTNEPSGGYGEMTAQAAPKVPENATVVSFDNESVQSSVYIKQAITQASNNENNASMIRIEKENVEQAETEFEALPRYRPTEPGVIPGVYISYNGTVYIVDFGVLD